MKFKYRAFSFIVMLVFLSTISCKNSKRLYGGRLKQHLDCAGWDKTKLPDSLVYYDTAYYIAIQYNPRMNYKKVSKQLEHFKLIETLGVAEKSLESFPVELAKLNNITQLDLRGGNFRRFPVEVKNMTNVKWILLDNNDLGKLTKDELDTFFNTLAYFPNIEELYLSRNSLSRLPKNITELKKLVRLDISKNKFNRIPEVLVDCKNIKWLHLDYMPCLVDSNSNVLGNMGKLENISISFPLDYNYIIIKPKINSLQLKFPSIDFLW